MIVTVECPVGDISFDKMQEICHSFSCVLKFQDKSKVYFEITGKAQDIFWLGMNLNHRLNGTDTILDLKKEKPWLYK